MISENPIKNKRNKEGNKGSELWKQGVETRGRGNKGSELLNVTSRSFGAGNAVLAHDNIFNR